MKLLLFVESKTNKKTKTVFIIVNKLISACDALGI
jgi:hypothetical protein